MSTGSTTTTTVTHADGTSVVTKTTTTTAEEIAGKKEATAGVPCDLPGKLSKAENSITTDERMAKGLAEHLTQLGLGGDGTLGELPPLDTPYEVCKDILKGGVSRDSSRRQLQIIRALADRAATGPESV